VPTGLLLLLDTRRIDKPSGIFSVSVAISISVSLYIASSSNPASCASQSGWHPSHNNSAIGKSSLLSPHALRS
jgi:hypothetical protein